MSTVLQAAGIGVRFGGVQALDSVGFELAEGELLGLIGPNGAGKTTLLRVIIGVVKPFSGSVSLAGAALDRLPVQARIRSGLGLAQQLVRPFRSMSVVDNVALAAGWAKTRVPLAALWKFGRGNERRRARELLERVGIADVAEANPASLPLGYLKRLEVARALALSPKVLLLDEPLAGLNQAEAGRLADTIVGLNREGLSIILIEHNLGEVMRVCERLVVLDNGRLLGQGPPREVMTDPVIRAAYLGRAG